MLQVRRLLSPGDKNETASDGHQSPRKGDKNETASDGHLYARHQINRGAIKFETDGKLLLSHLSLKALRRRLEGRHKLGTRSVCYVIPVARKLEHQV